MKTLVWVEYDAGGIKDATLSAVTAASQLGEVHLIVAGKGVDGVAADAAKIAAQTPAQKLAAINARRKQNG